MPCFCSSYTMGHGILFLKQLYSRARCLVSVAAIQWGMVSCFCSSYTVGLDALFL